MFDWIKENWEKIDEAVEKVIAFLKAFLGELGEWPIDVK